MTPSGNVLDSEEVQKEIFLDHFWWCWDRLKVHKSARSWLRVTNLIDKYSQHGSIHSTTVLKEKHCTC